MLWLLDFILPDWSIHLILLVGIVVLLISKFVPLQPQLIPYKTAITIGAWALIGYGVFMEGSIWKNDMWQAKIAEAEKRVLAAEAKASSENVRIVTQVVEKIKVVQDNKVIVDKKIVENASTIDAQCKVDPSVVEILNQAAVGVKK